MRKVVGWVVTLLPAEKGGAREWEANQYLAARFTTDKRNRFVRKPDEYAMACAEAAVLSSNLVTSVQARLRILPVYAATGRSARQERKAVVAFIRDRAEDLGGVVRGPDIDAMLRAELGAVATLIERGAHEPFP